MATRTRLLLLLGLAAAVLVGVFVSTRGGAQIYPTGGVAISPDGSRVAFRATIGHQFVIVVEDRDGGRQRVYARQPLDSSQSDTSLVLGRLVFTPDDQTLVYVAAGRLKLLQLSDGSIRDFAAGDTPLVSPDGHWVAYTRSGAKGAVFLVHRLAGGAETVAGRTSLSPVSDWPQYAFAPDSHTLYTLSATAEEANQGGTPHGHAIRSFALPSQKSSSFSDGGRAPFYVVGVLTDGEVAILGGGPFARCVRSCQRGLWAFSPGKARLLWPPRGALLAAALSTNGLGMLAENGQTMLAAKLHPSALLARYRSTRRTLPACNGAIDGMLPSISANGRWAACLADGAPGADDSVRVKHQLVAVLDLATGKRKVIAGH
jgi:hypothetical protein